MNELSNEDTINEKLHENDSNGPDDNDGRDEVESVENGHSSSQLPNSSSTFSLLSLNSSENSYENVLAQLQVDLDGNYDN